MLIPIERVGGLSFPDCTISDFLWNDRGNLSFVSDGLFIEGLGFLAERFAVECACYGEVLSRRFIDHKWFEVDPYDGGLYFIGEWATEQHNLRLAGFERTDGWREYFIALTSFTIAPSIPICI